MTFWSASASSREIAPREESPELNKVNRSRGASAHRPLRALPPDHRRLSEMEPLLDRSFQLRIRTVQSKLAVVGFTAIAHFLALFITAMRSTFSQSQNDRHPPPNLKTL
jgi:hypothetical protein